MILSLNKKIKITDIMHNIKKIIFRKNGVKNTN
jgi:hypothetical protein